MCTVLCIIILATVHHFSNLTCPRTIFQQQGNTFLMLLKNMILLNSMLGEKSTS